MCTITKIHNALYQLNAVLGKMGSRIAATAMLLMVVVILLQVFFRYVLNNALPWPDEAARFLMLWMTGVLAPVAYRHGGFVAIDMFENLIPAAIARIFPLFLLLCSFLVLIYGVKLGWDHVQSGWLFNSASLKIPSHWIGLTEKPIRVKLAWMYLSLFVGMVLLLLVNIELILRQIITLLDRDAKLPVLQLKSLEAE